MTEDTEFVAEPVPGHIVRAEVYEPSGELYDRLDEVRNEFDMPERDRRRVRIQVGDVEWGEVNEITMDIDVFEKLIGWYDD